MKHHLVRMVVIGACLAGLVLGGCGKQEDQQKSTGAPPTPAAPQTAPQATPPPSPPAPDKQAAQAAKPALPKATDPADVIVEVNGANLTYGQLKADVNKKMALLKGSIPAGKKKEVRESLNKSLINEFVGRKLLGDEMDLRKIKVSEKEVDEGLEKLKASLTKQGKSLEGLMKENRLTKGKLREELRFSLRIEKLVQAESAGKTKPADKEISEFYEKNKERFQMPDSARARHVLVAKAEGDNDQTKADKRKKAEELRKQLVGGADFGEVAKKSSDCPSKDYGGDLGTFSKGQMVKPFDDAVFSQKINDIGPVVETDFGYHIIQVLERTPAKLMALDEVKGQIAAMLEIQKKNDIYFALLKKLQDKAKIVMHKQP